MTLRDLPGCDFLLKGHQAASAPLLVLYLTESDYVGGNKRFKQRLARLYTASKKEGSEATVICQRTDSSTADFLAVQETFPSVTSPHVLLLILSLN